MLLAAAAVALGLNIFVKTLPLCARTGKGTCRRSFRGRGCEVRTTCNWRLQKQSAALVLWVRERTRMQAPLRKPWSSY